MSESCAASGFYLDKNPAISMFGNQINLTGCAPPIALVNNIASIAQVLGR